MQANALESHCNCVLCFGQRCACSGHSPITTASGASNEPLVAGSRARRSALDVTCAFSPQYST